MIVVSLKHLPDLFSLHPRFKNAFEFLQHVERNGIPEGHFELEGNDLFALVSSLEGNKEGKSPLEIHKHYIDIQYIISGVDHIGWRESETCEKNLKPYEEKDDKALFTDTPSTFVDVHSGQCAIFFQSDAHAPMNGPGWVKKVIVKVRI
jgi:biofilm protein TabA